jgi:hypothetical protein
MQTPKCSSFFGMEYHYVQRMLWVCLSCHHPWTRDRTSAKAPISPSPGRRR